jgi:hypothetical protein
VFGSIISLFSSGFPKPPRVPFPPPHIRHITSRLLHSREKKIPNRRKKTKDYMKTVVVMALEEYIMMYRKIYLSKAQCSAAKILKNMIARVYKLG